MQYTIDKRTKNKLAIRAVYTFSAEIQMGRYPVAVMQLSIYDPTILIILQHLI